MFQPGLPVSQCIYLFMKSLYLSIYLSQIYLSTRLFRVNYCLYIILRIILRKAVKIPKKENIYAAQFRVVFRWRIRDQNLTFQDGNSHHRWIKNSMLFTRRTQRNQLYKSLTGKCFRSLPSGLPWHPLNVDEKCRWVSEWGSKSASEWDWGMERESERVSERAMEWVSECVSVNKWISDLHAIHIYKWLNKWIAIPYRSAIV